MSLAMSHGPRKSREGMKRTPMGQRIHDLRQAKGMTQAELAAELDVTRAHVSKMESGLDAPSREALHAMGRIFNVSMDFIQTGRTETPKEGRFVNDPEQLAWLALFEAIPASERPRIARMLRAAALDRPD